MTEKYTPGQELRYQSKMLEQISKNSYIVKIAAIVFLVMVALQCSGGLLYLAGVLSISKLLLGGR